MTPAEKQALEGVAGRLITPSEESQIDSIMADRNDVAIATVLSMGRTRLQSKTIGVGTILESFGGNGGQFLDALNTLGQSNREVYWAMVLINNSNLDIGKKATQDQMSTLAAGMPPFAAGLQKLKDLGYVPDPIDYNVVSRALNIAQGRMVMS